MSGLSSGLGKVFKAVLPIAAIVAAPALLGGVGIAAGGAAAGVTGAAAPAAVATATGAAAGTAAGGFWAGIGSMLTNPQVIGQVVSGVAGGLAQGAAAKEEEEAAIAAEERQAARYEGVGDAALDGWGGPARRAPTRGLDVARAEPPPEEQAALEPVVEEERPERMARGLDAPAAETGRGLDVRTDEPMQTAAAEPAPAVIQQQRPRRPGLNQAGLNQQPRIRFDPQVGRVIYG